MQFNREVVIAALNKKFGNHTKQTLAHIFIFDVFNDIEMKPTIFLQRWSYTKELIAQSEGGIADCELFTREFDIRGNLPLVMEYISRH